MAQTSAPGIGLVSLIVEDYDEAIAFFTQKLGFILSEDKPAISTLYGHRKRWVVVKPFDGSGSAILLARADDDAQKAAIGNQWGGRVGLFLQTRDFEEQYSRMVEGGVEFLDAPRNEVYGRVVVFKDLYGNKWDLLGPTT